MGRRIDPSWWTHWAISRSSQCCYYYNYYYYYFNVFICLFNDRIPWHLLPSQTHLMGNIWYAASWTYIFYILSSLQNVYQQLYQHGMVLYTIKWVQRQELISDWLYISGCLYHWIALHLMLNVLFKKKKKKKDFFFFFFNQVPSLLYCVCVWSVIYHFRVPLHTGGITCTTNITPSQMS